MKKHLYIPLLVLSMLLLFTLWSGRQIARDTARWIDELQQADRLAGAEEWPDAQQEIQQVYRAWSDRQTYLHTTMEHGQLDQVELLFAAAFAACGQKDAPDFHAALEQLSVQLHLLAETQALSIRNIL